MTVEETGLVLVLGPLGLALVVGAYLRTRDRGRPAAGGAGQEEKADAERRSNRSSSETANGVGTGEDSGRDSVAE